MGYVLDSIVKYKMIDGPETVEDGYISEPFDISGIEAGFSIQLTYQDGVSVNLTLYLQVSTDGVTYIDFGDSDQLITDSSGSHLWDMPEGTGTNFIRIRVAGTGSIDVQQALLSGKRRH